MRSLLRLLLIALSPVAVAAPEPDPDRLKNVHIARTGFDCGGLVAYVFERAWGLKLPRRPEQQAKFGKRVSRHALEPGDLLFYNTRTRAFSYVGIYIGDGRFIHAPRRGQPIRAESTDHPYWAARFSGARRLAPPT